MDEQSRSHHDAAPLTASTDPAPGRTRRPEPILTVHSIEVDLARQTRAVLFLLGYQPGTLSQPAADR
jgi:hypothetical protein